NRVFPAVPMRGGGLRGKCALLAGAVLALGGAPQSDGQIVALTDNNSTVFLDSSSQQGMYHWNVQGVNQVQQQWFWYGIGNSPVVSIDTISAATIIQSGLNKATIGYANPGYSISVDALLSGGPIVPIGPGYGIANAVADMAETVK